MIRALDPNQENLKNNVSKSNFICLNPPINGTNPDKSPIDEWVILVHNDRDPINDHTCHFLLEETGYLLNRVIYFLLCILDYLFLNYYH